MNEKSKLKITTITPVAIGSGVELSQYADYVIDNNQICFIDKKKMQDKIFAKGDQYLEKYIYGVANGIDNNRSNFDLKNFLLTHKIVNNIDEVIYSRCPFITDKPEIKLPIKGIIKSPLQEPYFPGSSLKGALKTILMYNWLKTDKNSAAMIENVINDKNFDSLEKKFECFVNEEGKLVRPNTIQQVTDSKMLSKDSNIIVDCFREMQIRFECINKSKTVEFELTLENYKWEDLAKQANSYAIDCLNREFELIDKNEKTNYYHDHLADIEDDIMAAKENTAYIRIGFGKGYYLNSLGIAVYDYVSQNGKEDLYDKFERFLKQKFKPELKQKFKSELLLKEFPRTRLYVSKNQEPLGWIKIEKL
ncbi:MAG: type III-A CRISPR-associated RAMP protein Csm5 [Bacteroidales bacterium]|jgi:CRISPR-associated protein Csm5|nr:type III-A CRISPR-associated RAMP protein Csm5 [Bacteroidales bacterium]